MATITVEAHEIEGVAHWAEFLLEGDDVFPADSAKWRAGHARIGWMLDLLDTWRTARPGENVEIDEGPFLAEFAREGAEYGAEVLADALTGAMDRRYAQIGKGLISFADRLGVYEGVMV